MMNQFYPSLAIPLGQLCWHKYIPENKRLDTQNDGLEKVIPFKHGHFLVSTSMLNFSGCNGWGLLFFKSSRTLSSPRPSPVCSLGLPGSFVNTWLDNDIHLHPKEKCARTFCFFIFFPAAKMEKTSTIDFWSCFSSTIPSWWLNQPILKKMLVKLEHLPNFRGENTKCLSCHHLYLNVHPT